MKQTDNQHSTGKFSIERKLMAPSINCSMFLLRAPDATTNDTNFKNKLNTHS